jgi:hypothetical protein
MIDGLKIFMGRMVIDFFCRIQFIPRSVIQVPLKPELLNAYLFRVKEKMIIEVDGLPGCLMIF